MATLLSAGNDLSGNWYSSTSNTVPATTRLDLNVAKFTAVFTAPSISDSAVGIAFMIDDTPAGGTTGTWTLTLQEDATGAFGGAEADVATGTIDMDVLQLPDADGLAYIALSSPYQFTTANAGAYRWKLQTDGAAQNRARSDSSTTLFAYIGFDDRAAVPGNNDTIFTIGTELLDANITLGNGTTGADWVWTHAIYILNGGQLDFTDDGGYYKITLEGSVYVGSGGQLGSGVAMTGGGSGTFEWSMGAYADGDFSIWTGPAGKINLVGVTRTINTMYSSGDGATGTELKTTTDIGLAVDDYIQVLATDDFEETEFKYIKSGSHGAGWVLADTVGGAESGLSNNHTTDAPVLSLTRNITITTDSNVKGWRLDDNKLNTQPDGYGLGDDSIYSYVHLQNFYQADLVDCTRTGTVWDRVTSTANTTAIRPNNKVGRTHRYNIHTDSTRQTHSLADMLGTTGKNSIEQDSWFTVLGTNALSMSGGPMELKVCRFWDGNYDNDARAAGLGRTSTPINIIFSDCRNEAIQGVSALNVNTNATNVQFINHEFGTLVPSPNNINIFTEDAFLFTLLYKNCILNDTAIASGDELQTGLAGSFVKFHNYDQVDNRHEEYETNGIRYSSGPGLPDTVTVQAGELSYKIQSEDTSGGVVWEFKIGAPANSSVGFTQYFLENTAFYNSHGAGSSITMELFLPGETTAADALDVSTDVILAANAELAGSVNATYAGSIDANATIRITVKSETAGAYAYMGKLWNGLNIYTKLAVWDDARPSLLMPQDFSDPASVLNVLVAGNTIDGTLGQLVSILSYGGSVWIDVVNGTDVGAYPYGTSILPCKTLTNAKAIATANNILKINLDGTLTLDQDVSKLEFAGWKNGATIDLNNQTCTSAKFERLQVTGTQKDRAAFLWCKIDELQGLYGDYDDCKFISATALELQGQQVTMNDCISAIPGSNFITLDCTNDGVELEIRNISAGVKIINYTSATNLCDIGFNSGLLFIDATCTDGTIFGGGIFGLTDNSGESCTVELSARASDLSSSDIQAAMESQGYVLDIEGGYTHQEVMRVIMAAVSGKLSGADTATISIRDVADALDRIVATVDENGNRTAVVLDVSD